MKTNLTRTVIYLIPAYFYAGMTYAETDVDDFFAMSPAELAAMPVTIATGTPKPIFQSAAVTSVITAEQIKGMGATELHEVLETVPGIHVGLQGSSYDYKYSVRGISNNTNSQVLMLLNGTRITTPFRGTLVAGMELPIEAIEKVEVIRGPGSALYGADAFAGVINIITKKAKDIDGARVGVRAGNWDTESTWGQYGSQWAGWDVAGSLQYQHTAGDKGRIVKADAQSLFDSVLGTQASLAPGALNTRYETLNGHLNLQRKHWDLGFWAFNSIDAGTRAGGAGALDPKGDANTEAYLGDVRYATDDWADNWTFSTHASYLHTYYQAAFQAFPNNTLLPIGADGNIKSPFSGNPLVLFPDGANAVVGRTENIPSLDLNADYKGLQNHLLHISTGFRYEEIVANERKNFGTGIINGNQGIVNGTLTDVTGTPFVYLPDTHRSIWSAVLQDEWQFAKAWQLTAGVRYDNYSDFGGTVNPRAALVWDVNEQITTKLLYGRAFRAPNFSEQGNQNNPVLLGNRNLHPETINTYEWGLDYRPFSSLRTEVNVYYYEINDLILSVPDINQSTSTFQNAGSQNGYGTEFEWHWQWNEQWDFTGNYAWQEATNKVTNMPVNGVPEQQVYTAATWHFLPQWQLQSQLNWVGGIHSAPGDNRALGDYQTIDFTLRSKKLFKHLNLSASLRNALDERYRTPAPIQLPENLPMPGRSFYFEASVDF
ncbi:MAG: TonB-dependent receptor [Methylovulum sp.]|nr:TonB-dependent receptor [Methylovulum sp.]